MHSTGDAGMTDVKKRVTLSLEAEAVLSEIKVLTNAKSLSEATETMISLYGETVLSDLRAIKSGRGLSVRSQEQPMMTASIVPSQSVPQPVKSPKPKQVTTEAIDF